MLVIEVVNLLKIKEDLANKDEITDAGKENEKRSRVEAGTFILVKDILFVSVVII